MRAESPPIGSSSPAPGSAGAIDLGSAATLPADRVLADLGTTRRGLAPAEAQRRLERLGPNALRSQGALTSRAAALRDDSSDEDRKDDGADDSDREGEPDADERR